MQKTLALIIALFLILPFFSFPAEVFGAVASDAPKIVNLVLNQNGNSYKVPDGVKVNVGDVLIYDPDIYLNANGSGNYRSLKGGKWYLRLDGEDIAHANQFNDEISQNLAKGIIKITKPGTYNGYVQFYGIPSWGSFEGGKWLDDIVVKDIATGESPTIPTSEEEYTINIGDEEVGQLIQYPTYPEQLPRNYDYEVTVTQGDKTITLPVYNASRLSNAYHNTKNTDSYRRFCEFSFEGEVTVQVRPRITTDYYSVLPSSKGIKSTFENNTITFRLSQPENVVIRLNGDQNTVLSVFAEAPMEQFDYQAEINNGRDVIYFDAGYNNLNLEKSTVKSFSSYNGQVRVQGNTTLYLAPGALVERRLFVRNDNTKIIGRGALIDPHLDRSTSYSNASHMIHVLNDGIYDSSVDNLLIEGIRILDANTFNIDMGGGVDNALVKDVKILSSSISTDGVGLHSGCSNVTVDGAFMYVNDNAVIVGNSKENLVIKNSTIGTRHAIFYPQGNGAFTLENINVFDCGDFFRVAETTSTGRSWNVTGKNIHAEDAPDMSNFIYIQMQSNNNRAVATLENVSLPANFLKVQTVNSGGFTFNLNNVFAGGRELKNESMFISGSSYSGITFNFGTTFNKTLAGANTLVDGVKLAYYKGDGRVKVGSFALDNAKIPPTKVLGVVYVPALSTLNYLGYTAHYEKETLTFSDENGTVKIPLNSNTVNFYGIDFTQENALILIDDTPMLSAEFLLDAFSINYSVVGDDVVLSAAENGELLKDNGFENLSNPNTYDNKYNYFNHIYSRNWSYFNFASAYEETNPAYVHSGNSSLRLAMSSGGTRGMAQYITPQIKQNGAGVYHLQAWVKVYDSNLANNPTSTSDKNYPVIKDNGEVAVNIGITEPGWRIYNGNSPIGISNLKQFTVGTQWQKISCDITITNPNADGYDRAFFFVGTLSGGSIIVIDDVSLTFTKSLSSADEIISLDASTENGKLLKGWYDSDGNLYKTTSNILSAVNLHPEYINVGKNLNGTLQQSENDPCPTPENANYINGMYVQGAQLRIGEGLPTAIRFVTVNNTDLITTLSQIGFTNISYGTLVSRVDKFVDNYCLTFNDIKDNRAADVKADKIYLTSADLNTNYQKYTACVINIPQSDYKTNIYARPYIKYTDLSGVQRVIYGEQYKTSLYEVAEMAYSDQSLGQTTKTLIKTQVLSK